MEQFLEMFTPSPNIADNKDTFPLHVAARLPHRGLAELLLTHGADVLIKNGQGEAAIHCAAIGGDFKIAQMVMAQLSVNQSLPG